MKAWHNLKLRFGSSHGASPASMLNALESRLESCGTHQGLSCLVSLDVQFWFFQPEPAKNFAYILKISNNTFRISKFSTGKAILISKDTSLAFFPLLHSGPPNFVVDNFDVFRWF